MGVGGYGMGGWMWDGGGWVGSGSRGEEGGGLTGLGHGREVVRIIDGRGGLWWVQMCGQEHQLFDHFFPSSSADPANLAPLIDPL